MTVENSLQYHTSLFFILNCQCINITIIIFAFAVWPPAARSLLVVAIVVLERVDPGVPAAVAGTGGPSAFAVAQQRGRRRYVLRSASTAATEKTGAHAASSSAAATPQATQAIGQRRVAVERGIRSRLTYRHREEEALEKVSVLSSHLEQRFGECQNISEKRETCVKTKTTTVRTGGQDLYTSIVTFNCELLIPKSICNLACKPFEIAIRETAL